MGQQRAGWTCLHLLRMECAFLLPTLGIFFFHPCSRLTVFQFPWLITINTLAPALLAGNSVLLKPSPQTPLVGDRLKEAFDKAGLPKDVLQILHLPGRLELQAVVKLPKIRQVCFTGSTGGGLAIRRSTADRVVPVNLELGGNDP